MNPVPDSEPRVPAKAPPAPGFLAVPILLGALWAQLYWALHPTWIHSQYYDYGWIVPPLAFWFFWRRWKDETPSSRPHAASAPFLRAAAGIAILLAGLVFVRILERFDPIWRIPLILHTGIAVAATLLLLLHFRGPRKSLSYLPLLLFAATACPWPAGVENRIVGELTDALLAVSAPLSRMVGIPVELSGSALISEGRVISIDEGCSGIRSFQSLIMAGLFVGEFLLLKWRWRAFLLALAVVVGFGTNTLRATALTWIFVHEGQTAFDQLHDTVGFLAFGLAAGLLLLCGRALDHPIEAQTAPRS